MRFPMLVHFMIWASVSIRTKYNSNKKNFTKHLFAIIVHSAASCASQPISLHRILFFAQLNQIFCQYLLQLLSKIIK